jgi:hypothetical protein
MAKRILFSGRPPLAHRVAFAAVARFEELPWMPHSAGCIGAVEPYPSGPYAVPVADGVGGGPDWSHIRYSSSLVVLTLPAPDTCLGDGAGAMPWPGQAIFLLSDVLLLEDPQADLPLNGSCWLRTHKAHPRAETTQRLWTSVQNPGKPAVHPQQRLSGLLTVGSRTETSSAIPTSQGHTGVDTLCCRRQLPAPPAGETTRGRSRRLGCEAGGIGGGELDGDHSPKRLWGQQTPGSADVSIWASMRPGG